MTSGQWAGSSGPEFSAGHPHLLCEALLSHTCKCSISWGMQHLFEKITKTAHIQLQHPAALVLLMPQGWSKSWPQQMGFACSDLITTFPIPTVRANRSLESFTDAEFGRQVSLSTLKCGTYFFSDLPCSDWRDLPAAAVLCPD